MPLFGPPNVEKMKAKRDVKGLIRVLDHRYGSGLANQALEAIVGLGSEAVDALILALHDKNGDVCASAALALGRIRDRRALQPLISALRRTTNDAFVQGNVAKALGILHDTQAIEPLCEAASGSITFVVVPILESFGDTAIACLLARLRSQDPSTRRGAAYAMQYLQGPSSRTTCFEPLMEALRDKDSGVRVYAADALVRIGVDASAAEQAVRAAYAAEQDLSARLRIGADLHAYDKDYRSSAFES